MGRAVQRVASPWKFVFHWHSTQLAKESTFLNKMQLHVGFHARTTDMSIVYVQDASLELLQPVVRKRSLKLSALFRTRYRQIRCCLSFPARKNVQLYLYSLRRYFNQVLITPPLKDV